MLRTRLISSVAFLLAGACASPGLPPGGPPDAEAPKVLAVAPESGRANVSPPAVVFRFDELVNEKPSGAPALSDLFVISPQDGVPEVDWGGKEIAVKPRAAWRRNTVYMVQLLPGISDLRGNVSTTGATTVFSTGATIPATRLSGTAFDWAAGVRAAGARIEAITSDGLVYATVSDSSGDFSFAHLPAGPLTVRAILDENRNRALDPPEKWDSASVSLVDTASVTFFAYARDSIPPRLTDVVVTNSVTLRLRFDVPLDPSQSLEASSFSLQAADSSIVAVRSAAFAPPDSPARIPRRVPPREIVLSTALPITRNTNYTVTAQGIRGLTGFTTVTGHTFRMRSPAAPNDTTAATIRPPSR